MAYVNKQLLNRIPEHVRDSVAYYPDVLLFDFNQHQYTSWWQELSQNNYLYTDGVEVQPTNWFMYVFQSFKGWLGFDNHCQSEKISYTLDKLAYYGYSKGFSQPDFSSLSAYPLSSDISSLAAQTPTNEITAQLQTRLVNEYCSLVTVFPQTLRRQHRFGESWLTWGAMDLIPQLDPQDNTLIRDVIKAIDSDPSLPEFTFLRNSKYAKTAAQYYCDKAKNTPPPTFIGIEFFGRLLWTDPKPALFNMALSYDPAIAKREANNFIEHHLAQKNYPDAFNLLGLLSDEALVLKFLKAIPEKERNTLIIKDTPVAAVMAKEHLKNKQYQLALLIYSDIESLNPEAAFVIAIAAKEYDQAYAIFERHKDTIQFSLSDRKLVAKVFFDKGDEVYEQGKTAKASQNWPSAQLHYLRSLAHKNAAYALNPTPEYQQEIFTHKRLYAQLLIDMDIALNTPAENSDIVSIRKALELLNQCQPTQPLEQHRHQLAIANGLMRRIDTLREKISTELPLDYTDMVQHKEQHRQEFNAFIRTLEELILLLKGTKDPELRLKLGKAHYLLADVHSNFSINYPDIKAHYKMAMNTVPENPFYTLAVAEAFPDDPKREAWEETGILGIRALGYDGAMDFYHWSNERWLKPGNIIHDIKDIHSAPVQEAAPAPRSWFSFG